MRKRRSRVLKSEGKPARFDDALNRSSQVGTHSQPRYFFGSLYPVVDRDGIPAHWAAVAIVLKSLKQRPSGGMMEVRLGNLSSLLVASMALITGRSLFGKYSDRCLVHALGVQHAEQYRVELEKFVKAGL